jgi:translation initiation factor 3 subunit L
MDEEVVMLRETPQTWGCYSVLNVLYSLIQRSQMNEQLAASKMGRDPAYVDLPYHRNGIVANDCIQ